MSNKGLGKGLDALLPQETEETEGLKTIPVDQIKPDPDQPRKRFDSEKLDELTRSIKNQGLIEPVIVRPEEEADRFVLVAGERRWRASCQAGKETIPAIVRELTETEALSISLIENIQRANLTPVEEARAYQRLMNQQDWDQSQLAEHVGKSRSAVANRLRLLNLPDVVLDHLEEEKISAGHARALLGLNENEKIKDVLEQITNKEWSVRKTESEIQALNTQEESKTEPPTSSTADSKRNYGAVEAELEEAVGASVSIETDDHREGYIQIYFSNPDEFDSLRKRIRQLNTS